MGSQLAPGGSLHIIPVHVPPQRNNSTISSHLIHHKLAMQIVQVESVELAQSLMGDLHEEMLFQIGSSPRALEASVAESGMCQSMPPHAAVPCTHPRSSCCSGVGIQVSSARNNAGVPCLMQLHRAPSMAQAADLGGSTSSCGTVCMTLDTVRPTPSPLPCKGKPAN